MASWEKGSGDLCPHFPGSRQLGNVHNPATWASGPRQWVESGSDPGLLRTLMPTQPGQPRSLPGGMGETGGDAVVWASVVGALEWSSELLQGQRPDPHW